MNLPSQTNPHLARYDMGKLAEALSRANRTADEYLFGMLHGEKRQAYALNFYGIRVTFEDLDMQIEEAARSLYGYGVRKGDCVSILMPNMIPTVVYIYACWRIGAVINMIDPRTHCQGILERVKLTNSKLLITMMNLCEAKVEPIVDELPVENVVAISFDFSTILKVGIHMLSSISTFLKSQTSKDFKKEHMDKPGNKYILHSDFIKKYTTIQEDIRAVFEPGMPAAVLYTSGTSADGIIKGAVLTHEAYNSAPGAFRRMVGSGEYQRGYKFGGFIPFFSAYGSMSGMHAALCGGMELILVPIFDPNKFAEMLLSIKPNVFFGVPRFHEQLADHPKLQKKNDLLSFIKIPISGGDKISPATIERVNAAYKRSGYNGGLRVGYGSTELGGSIAVMPDYNPEKDDFPWDIPGNVGFLMPHCRGMVINPDTGEELPFGEDGELCMHSACQMLEYYNMPKETEEITHIGPDGTKYYRMGDKGHLDETGCFYFVDRYKRSMMRPDGHTVHPSPIENVIMGHEAVELCAVVGLRQAENSSGSIPSALVILREEYKTSPEKIRETLTSIDEYCLKRLPERDRAIAYKSVEEVPYTLMGKINFRELEKQLVDTKTFLIRDLAFFPELQDKK